MSARSRGWRDAVRWGACFALALCFHVAGAAALLAHWNGKVDPIAQAPAILVELSPLPVAPQTKPTPLPPGRQQSEVKPQPQPKKTAQTVALTPPPAKVANLAVMPPPKPLEKPKPKKPPRKQASLASASSTAAHRAQRAAAAAPGATSRNPDALPNWKSRLMATLERYKRYPAEAQARGDEGVAQLAFSVDRAGRVHHARILRSSGSDLLDRATLSLIERAQPLPAPPPQVHGAEIAIVVPIRYSIR